MQVQTTPTSLGLLPGDGLGKGTPPNFLVLHDVTASNRMFYFSVFPGFDFDDSLTWLGMHADSRLFFDLSHDD